MDFHKKAEAALITIFGVSDSITQQQMVMLYWWKDQKMKRAVEKRKANKRRWWVNPWIDDNHESASGEASTMFLDLVEQEQQKASAVSKCLEINSRLFYEVLSRTWNL